MKPISRRMMLKAGAVSGLGVAFGPMLRSAGAATPSAGLPRHLCLIFADDMGLQCGPYGDGFVPTPALDRLSSQGCTFDHAYCAQPTCSPSRSALYTGLYPHQNGQYGLAGWYGYRLHEGVPIFPNLLHNAGFYTGLTYKIHVDPEDDFRFDRQFGEGDYRADGSDVKDSVQTGQYLREMLGSVGHGQRSFLMPQTHDPHRPLMQENEQGRNRFRTRLDDPGSPYRIVKPGEAPLLPHFGEGLPVNDWFSSDMAEYYNAVQRVDRGVGIVLDELERAGVLDETLVIFSSDHGPSYGRGKLSCHELGVKVPLMMRCPSLVSGGTRRSQLVSLLDLMPTFLEVAGLEVPDYVAGRSLLPLLASNNASWRTTLACEMIAHSTYQDYWPSRSLRDDRYKVILSQLVAEGETGSCDVIAEGCPDYWASRDVLPGTTAAKVYDTFLRPPRWQLYDLREDPYELNNLSADPDHADTLARLQTELSRWQKATADPFAEPAFLDAFTARYQSRSADIDARAKADDQDPWQQRFVETDQSIWSRPWPAVREQLIEAKRAYGSV